MAETYAHRTQNRGAGISPEEWIRRYIDTLPITGKVGGNSETVKGFNASGQPCDIPRGHACLLFTDLVLMRQENRSNHGGNAPTVQGKPIQVLDLKEGFRAVMGLATHALIPGSGPGRRPAGVCLVPLYQVNDNNENVMGQCGAQWVGCGDPFKLDYHPHNTALMYMYGIQSTIWALANENQKSRVPELAQQVALLVQAAKDLFAYQTQAFQIVEPLKDADDAVDMLNRAIAFIFLGTWVSEDLLRILEICLKRWRKYLPGNPEAVDFVKNPIFGIIGIMIMVPALRDMVQNKASLAATAQKINDGTLALMVTIAENISKDAAERNKIILHKLCQLSGEGGLANYGRDKLDRLYDYCMRRDTFDQLAPLVDWEFIPAMTCPFVFDTKGLVQNKAVKFQSKVKPLGMDGGDGFRVTSTQPAEWTPLQLLSPGIYRITGELVGGATVGQGQTMGKTDTAIIRFTTGQDVMPQKGKPIPGISTAGMHYCLAPSGKWDFVNTGRALDPLKPFRLVIRRNGSFAIYPGDAQVPWYEDPRVVRPVSDDPLPAQNVVMMGFKFLRLTIRYENLPPDSVSPNLPVPAAAASSSEKPSAPAEDDISGLTGVALMKKLAELSLKEPPKDVAGKKP